MAKGSRRAAAAPPSNTKRPAEGGSYIRKPDGSFERREFTRQWDHPEHVRHTPPEPAAQATEPSKED